MAVILLQVLVLGVIAAAADDVPITWWSTPRAALSCVVPDADRIPARRPPPPLSSDDQSLPKQPYLWRKGNNELKRVLSNGTLEVSRKKNGSSEGVYQCAVRHPAGLVLGYPHHLKFAHLDKQFSVHPANTTAWTGQPFVLGCEIGSGPAAIITWLRDEEPLPQNNRSFVLKNQLLILDVKEEDAGFYRCKATNPQANRTRISDNGRLQVEQYPQTEQAPSLLAVNQDSNIVAARGTEIILPCPVTGYPQKKLIWTYTPLGERTGELEHVDEVLTLRKLDSYHEGVYNCTVEGYSELNKSFKVTVAVPVKITVPPTSKEALRASTVRFNCTATGHPAPTVVWYKDGVPVTLTGRIAIRPSADDNKLMQLLIRTVTSDDTGIYQCFAHNGHSTASAWAFLNVTGGFVEPPRGLNCAPIGPHRVLVWWPPINGTMAYTVEISKTGGASMPSQPCTDTATTITLREPLLPYNFWLRAYILTPINNRTVATDMSDSVSCHGQGVPIKIKRSGEEIAVSWKQFSKENPGVLQWILQYKLNSSSEENNITLGSSVTNYTLMIPPPSSVHLRVLATRELPWLQQNLTLVPWTSTSNMSQQEMDAGEVILKVQKVTVTDLGPVKFVVRWEAVGANTTGYIYIVCITKMDEQEQCIESNTTWALVKGLTPSSEYSVRVKAKVPSRSYSTSEFTQPVFITTPPEDAAHITDVTYKLINSTSLRVSWNSIPDRYIVRYYNELKLPINEWPSQETFGNTIVLLGLNMSKDLYVMVSRTNTETHSAILHIPVLVPEVKNISHSFTSSGLEVSWQEEGARTVRYSQDIIQPLDRWHTIDVNTNFVLIRELDDSLSTFITVTAPGLPQTKVFTVYPRPPVDNTTFYLSVGVGVGVVVVVLCLMLVAAFYAWRTKKGPRLIGPRRRNQARAEGHEEDGTDMKNMGGQLANGGSSKDAGEPLLNGHVHITENPNASKTPNGRMRKGRQYEHTFDVARYDDPDTTLDTVLDDSTTTFNLLDTSRRPEYDLARSSQNLTATNSFNKLPDDNMNSELTRSTDFQLDNSKILPTLQPNG